MLTGIHFLLTYKCTSECDHCFVHGSPSANGTFTVGQIKSVLDEAAKINTIKWIYFEGGEPFLFYPLMLEGIKIAREKGFRTGIVTNAYWAASEENAELCLKPLRELGIADLSVSDDAFHSKNKKSPAARHALNSARRLGIPAGSICVEIGSGVMFKGRAAHKLADSLLKRNWEEFTECPYENLESPGRVHVDSYGNVHLCQGISMGNLWETPLSMLIKNYNPAAHPIAGPLIRGGPVQLAKEYNVKHEEKYADACHLCYLTRLALIDKFPKFLAPRQVYGME